MAAPGGRPKGGPPKCNDGFMHFFAKKACARSSSSLAGNSANYASIGWASRAQESALLCPERERESLEFESFFLSSCIHNAPGPSENLLLPLPLTHHDPQATKQWREEEEKERPSHSLLRHARPLSRSATHMLFEKSVSSLSLSKLRLGPYTRR